MTNQIEVALPSGAKLKITISPFAEAKALHKAVLKEIKHIPMSNTTQLGEIVKNFFCDGFTSPEIEQCLAECFKRVQYCDKRGELKIDKDTFEPLEAREDYAKACIAVVEENIRPFAKSLYAEYVKYLSILGKNLS